MSEGEKDKTLRQEIEQINCHIGRAYNGCQCCEYHNHCTQEYENNLIITAVKKVAQKMPKDKYSKDHNLECQSYWKKQLK